MKGRSGFLVFVVELYLLRVLSFQHVMSIYFFSHNLATSSQNDGPGGVECLCSNRL